MREFDELAQELQRMWSDGGRLDIDVTGAPFVTFRESRAFVDALNGLGSNSLALRDLGSMTMLDGKVALVASSRGWSATLARRRELPEFASTVPFPTILMPIGAGEIEIVAYALEPGKLTSAELEPGRHLRPVNSDVYSDGHPFFLHATINAYSIGSVSDGVVLLRITGPEVSPYIHFFSSADLEYSHTAFAAPEYSARLFFAEFLKNLTYEADLAHFDPDELLQIEQFVSERVRGAADMPHEVWSLLQALHVVNGEKSRELLSELADQPGPLRAIAHESLLEQCVRNEIDA